MALWLRIGAEAGTPVIKTCAAALVSEAGRSNIWKKKYGGKEGDESQQDQPVASA